MVLRDKAGNMHRYDFTTEIVHVDVDCETKDQVSASQSSAMLIAAVTKVPCLPTFRVTD